jgi:selenocysteine-specific elongation factor
VAIQRGDRFILRQPSPSQTLGGGTVVNPYPGRRWRRFRPDVIAMLEDYRSGEPAKIFLRTLQRLEPVGFTQVAAASSLLAEEALQACQALLAGDQVAVLDRDWPAEVHLDQATGWQERLASVQSLVSAQGWEMLAQRMVAALGRYHRQFPLRQGMPREELKSRLQGRGRRRVWSLRLFNEVVAHAAAVGVLVEHEGVLRLPDHQVALNAGQKAAVERLLAQFSANPYTPPSVAESVAAVGEDVFAWLVDSGQLMRLSEDVVFTAETYDRLLAGVQDHLRREDSITVAQVRDRFGTTRKYALALMEYLDAQRITRRVGDARVLRKG